MIRCNLLCRYQNYDGYLELIHSAYNATNNAMNNLYLHRFDSIFDYILCLLFVRLFWWREMSRGTQNIDTMLGQCWSSIYDAGSALRQHWVSVSCLLGID